VVCLILNHISMGDSLLRGPPSYGILAAHGRGGRGGTRPSSYGEPRQV
jgi:hypothetical protein